MHCSSPLSPSFSFPSLSPMWHKGLSYTPPLLRLCQESSSVRLLLYRMREIHLALCTRWSVKRESPFILRWGAGCTWDSFFLGGFFKSCGIKGIDDQWWTFRSSDLLLITHVALSSPTGESLSAGVDRAIWCFVNQRDPCPSSGIVLNFLAESPLDVGSQCL